MEMMQGPNMARWQTVFWILENYINVFKLPKHQLTKKDEKKRYTVLTGTQTYIKALTSLYHRGQSMSIYLHFSL